MLFIPVYHPKRAFTRPADLGPLTAHVSGYVRRVLFGLPRAPTLEVQPNVERLRWLVKECLRRKLPLAVDVETGAHGLLPKFAKLTAIGVGADIDNGVGLSWSWPPPPPVLTELRRALANAALAKVGMNARHYDWPILRRYGFELRGELRDIKQMRRALSSTSRLGLGPQASYYCLAPPWKAQADLEDEMKGLFTSRGDVRTLLRYNAEDCARTAQVDSGQRRDLASDPADKARVRRIYEQQLRLAWVSSEMSYKGFPVDAKERARLATELTTLGQQRNAHLRKLVRPYELKKGAFRTGATGANPGDLAALIYDEANRPGIRSFGLEVPLNDVCRTETGKASVAQDALLYLYALPNTPKPLRVILKAHWQAAAPWKALSTFVSSKLIDEAIGPDGRLHAGINSDGTETSRWNCQAPNLFNLSESQDEEKGSLRGDLPSVRSMYVAPPGHVIVHRDMAQFEIHVMAEYTEDEPLRAALLSGDVHAARARQWFGVPDDVEVPKQIRKSAKIGGLAFQYCASVQAAYMQWLKQDQNADWDEIELLHEAFPERHPGIKRHWEESLAFAQEHGYSEAPLMNWRRYYPPDAPIKVTETSNYAIQGGAAAIMNSVFVGSDKTNYSKALYPRLKKLYPSAWIAMHTYDSIDVICRDRDAVGIGALMEECMRGPWNVKSRPYEYPSDMKIGKRWSEV